MKDLLLTDEELTEVCGWESTQGIDDYERGIAQAQHKKDMEVLKGKWVDKPDSEGWWWLYGAEPYRHPEAISELIPIFIYGGKRLHTKDEGIGYTLDLYRGQWCKAIVPEVEGRCARGGIERVS